MHLHCSFGTQAVIVGPAQSESRVAKTTAWDLISTEVTSWTICVLGLSATVITACKYHNFLASRVDWDINYLFGALTSKAIDCYVNESILRGSGGGGPREVGEFGGMFQNFTEPLSQNFYHWVPQLEPFWLAPLLGDLIKGGVWVPGHRNALK